MHGRFYDFRIWEPVDGIIISNGTGAADGIQVVPFSVPHWHRRTGQFFSRGLSHLCPKNLSTAPEKRLC